MSDLSHQFSVSPFLLSYMLTEYFQCIILFPYCLLKSILFVYICGHIVPLCYILIHLLLTTQYNAMIFFIKKQNAFKWLLVDID
jgi:hypothetical protein